MTACHVYLGKFKTWTDVAIEFAVRWPHQQATEPPAAEPSAVFAVYDTGSWEGFALVLFVDDAGDLQLVSGYHNSEEGFYDQWCPEEESAATILFSVERAEDGVFRKYGPQITEWLAAL